MQHDPVQISSALYNAIGGHPLVAEILTRRGITTPAAARAFLDPACYTPSPPTALPDLTIAAQRLTDAIASHRRIGVWGDFDVDGQTATTVLVSALRALGAEVIYYIPHRMTESHGITLEGLEKFMAQGVQVLLTCDTGIAAHEAIEHARKRNVVVLVSDHHDLPDQLPPADALVNPKRLPPEHPLRDLPGVGVAYKLAQELYASFARPDKSAQDLLDLVALGIVADVAEQKADTRYLLQLGLDKLRHPQRIGLQAMFETAGLDPTRLSTEHIAFGLGPRLNALGRLGDANLAVELLTTRDWSRARILAAQLEGLNNQRKFIGEQIYAAAQEQIAREPALLDAHALVLAHPHWHGGIIGPIAGRLAEYYGSPVVLLVSGAEGIARGSARSVPGCNIYAALKRVSHYLLGYGGHPGAAGLSIPVEQIPAFRRAFSKAVDAEWDRTLAPPGAQIDAYVSLGDLTLELALELERLAPFGQGNPPVRLATREVSLVSQRAFGRNGEHREMIVQDQQGVTCKLIWWRGAEQELPAGRFDLAYTLKSTDYQGRPSLVIEWSEARAVEMPVIEIAAPPKWEMIDWRQETNLRARVESLRAAGDVQIWVEGASELHGQRRHELCPASTLVIWSAPPGPRELQAALGRVSPRRVIVCGLQDCQDAPHPFLRRLAGLLKYDLTRRAGQVYLPALAAATGQRLATARKGIEWLAARGRIAIETWEGDELRIVEQSAAAEHRPPTTEHRPTTTEHRPPTSNQQPDGNEETAQGTDIEQIEADLRVLLTETAAYRAYFRRASLEHILKL